MYIILKILGKQYKVYEGIILKINFLNLNLNDIVIFNKILLFVNIKKNLFILNNIFLNKIFVVGRILSHKKSKKINILKFKRRKNYKKIKNYKYKYTEIIIEKINFIKNGN